MPPDLLWGVQQVHTIHRTSNNFNVFSCTDMPPNRWYTYPQVSTPLGTPTRLFPLLTLLPTHDLSVPTVLRFYTHLSQLTRFHRHSTQAAFWDFVDTFCSNSTFLSAFQKWGATHSPALFFVAGSGGEEGRLRTKESLFAPRSAHQQKFSTVREILVQTWKNNKNNKNPLVREPISWSAPSKIIGTQPEFLGAQIF